MQRTYKIAHNHTNIWIRRVDELTSNVLRNFVQDIVFRIPDIKFFYTVRIVFAITLKNIISLIR